MADDAPHLSRRKRLPAGADGWPEPVEGRCNHRLVRNDVPHRCGRRAGWGTATPGYGECRTHGGQLPNKRAAATQQMYADRFAGRIRFGQVLETDPRLGLLQEFNLTNGMVAYLVQELADTAGVDGRPELMQQVATAGGGSHRDVHPLVRVLQWERAHLARIAKMIEDIGFSEEQLDLFRAYQDRVVDLIEAVVRDLGRDPDDPEVRRLVAGRLALVAAPGVAG